MSEKGTVLPFPPVEGDRGLALAEPRPWSQGLLNRLSDGDHAVQFYEDDELLVDAVAHFGAAGLAAEEPVLIVATEEHRAAFADRLRRNGAEPDSALASGLLTMLDAKETLARFMVGDEPEWNRFRAALSLLLEKCRAGWSTARVRVFGEMVDLLWRAENRGAAIRLEEFWNELARQQPFTLLCAYKMGNFFMPAESASNASIWFDQIVSPPTAGDSREYRHVPSTGSGENVMSLCQRPPKFNFFFSPASRTMRIMSGCPSSGWMNGVGDSGPKWRANASCWSGVSSWSRRKITQCSASARRSAVTVSASRRREASTPEISAPPAPHSSSIRTPLTRDSLQSQPAYPPGGTNE